MVRPRRNLAAWPKISKCSKPSQYGAYFEASDVTNINSSFSTGQNGLFSKLKLWNRDATALHPKSQTPPKLSNMGRILKLSLFQIQQKYFQHHHILRLNDIGRNMASGDTPVLSTPRKRVCGAHTCSGSRPNKYERVEARAKWNRPVFEATRGKTLGMDDRSGFLNKKNLKKYLKNSNSRLIFVYFKLSFVYFQFSTFFQIYEIQQKKFQKKNRKKYARKKWAELVLIFRIL